MKSITNSQPLSIVDGIAIVAGMVIGPGIFKTPAIVAANSGDSQTTLLLWLLGGAISLMGALCYAELASTFPHKGGEYHFLYRSFGEKVSFLFAWARMTVIQTGSMAMLSFLIGDYASQVVNLGNYSSSYYAAFTIILLTMINVKGMRQSSILQKTLMAGILMGLFFIIITGTGLAAKTMAATERFSSGNAIYGRAMIFVLLTYGGWNEAAYLSAEISSARGAMARVLFYSIGLITTVYLLANYSFLHGLGYKDVIESEAVAADLMQFAWGTTGAKILSAVVAIAALSTVNAVIITGARTNYALGKDFKIFKFLAQWKESGSTPVNALFLQAAIALLLVALGTGMRSGFITMVEYTAPVFWFFFLLVGASVFILRYKEPAANRPFRVPLYPIPPILFTLAAAYMLQSSLAYTGVGALVGVTVLIAGAPMLFFMKKKD